MGAADDVRVSFRPAAAALRATPDSECYYPSTTHEQALARLLQSIEEDEGLALLTGEPGMGKTLLCHCVLERLGPDVTSAFLTNSHFPNRTGLLQAILYDLSLPYEGRGEQELRLSLTESLLKNFTEGRRTVLLVDEAHHLTPDLLEEVRLLGNLESRHGKALQVILLAQPGLCQTLSQPELASLCQRMVACIDLQPFSIHEAADYLLHQLRAAGGKPERILSDERWRCWHAAAWGCRVCSIRPVIRALALAHEADAASVDAEAALEALALLGLSTDSAAAEGPVSTGTQEEWIGLEPAPSAAAPGLPIRQESEDAAARKGLQGETSRPRRLFAQPRRSA